MGSTTLEDRVTRSIEIAAPADRVWDLVSEPGWFVNEHALVVHRIEQVADDVHVVHDPVHGAFAFRTVTLDPPRYAAFRWQQSVDDLSGPSTLIEFTIDELASGAVRLTVTESGFASLPGDVADHRRRIEENTEGWTVELDLARDALEGRGPGAGYLADRGPLEDRGRGADAHG